MECSGDVLVVDDDKAINQVLCRFLQGSGFRVRPALDGQSALEQVRASLPRAILLDLMLPDITGFEVCEELKRDPQTQSIPVIMITALADDDSIERGKACGAMAYLTKPFDLDKLVATLKEAVKG